MRSYFFMVLVAALFALTACGGGTTALPGPEVQQDAALSGTLLESGGLHSVSMLSGIGDATVTLVSIDDGSLLGTQTTAPDGSFEFVAVQPGDAMLTAELPGDIDLDGDALSDDLTFTTPVHLDAGGTFDFTSTYDLQDLNDDGLSDSIELTTVMMDETGNTQEDSRLLVPEEEAVYFDSDNDGEFTDETAYDDVDGDGLPDELVGHMNSLHGGMLKGPIEEIADDYSMLVVEGITFLTNDETEWKDKGNKEPDMSVFAVGVNVLIRGYYNGSDWIAMSVKTTGVRGGGDDGGDDGGAGGSDGGDGGGGGIVLF